jgi:protein TonB
MRFLPALLGALLITVAVFLFMQSLIRSQQPEDMALLVHTHVEVVRPEPEEEEPEPEDDMPEEPKEEPVMESLEVAPPKPEPAAELEIAALDLAVGDIDVKAVGDHWSAPMGTGVVNMGGGGGEDAHGFIEVIPFDTRKPNVPEVAWQNKISGWVLVAFNVTPQGGTRNVRVLDARPRGVFEEKVVAAVQDWRYTVNFHGKTSTNVVLTQKVDVLWQNYPNNLPNVD